ncbi:DUF6266 family protein [Pedobacter gandavensis]|uniref:DUF6266 family protein n=1 Tax=Pedobacter gandavensis TaxID=2679963 RepID=UPI0029314AC3|nr:DUF6266 family protein [Pedobacter gandavensis]
MSISRNGMHGYPSGKLGNVVSYMLRGQLVHRTVGKPGKPSPKQKANHESMRVITHFLGHFKDYLNNGFELEARGTIRNQHNLAVSYNKKNALQGEYPNISVDYAKIQFSKGTLKNPEGLRMEKVEGGLQISWDPFYQSAMGSQYDDCLQLAVYFPKSRRQKIELNFSKREMGTAFLALAEEELESSMEVYLFLSAANHDSVSDTLYLGNLNGAWENQKIIAEKGKNVETEALYENARYVQVMAQYKGQMELKPENRIPDKAFRNLETEYLVLRNRYESTSRSRQSKPG